MLNVLQVFLSIIAIALSYILYQVRKVYIARTHITKWIPQVPGSLYFGAKSKFGPTKDRIKNTVRLLDNPEKSVYLEFLNNWVIVTQDYDLMEFILSSNELITKGSHYKTLAQWLGYGLLISNGQKWKTSRRIITPTFHFSILEQFVDVFNSNEAILIDKLKREAIGKKGVEIYSYITNCALDILCETAMGVKMDSQQNKNKEYTDAVKDMCEIVAVRILSFWKNSNWLFPLSVEYKRQQKNLKILHGFTNSVIEKRKKELESRKYMNNLEEVDSLGRKRKKVFLDLLLESSDNNLSQDDIRDEVDTFMFAGHDTTSSAITSGILLLSERPDIQKSVRDELKEIIGSNRDRPLTYNDLQNMTYLELVVKEILRLKPPVPFISRQVTKDIKYKDHIIPKDTMISLFLYGMNRDPAFHQDPDKFNPDRFLSTDKKAYSFIPFSAGPRNCIGQKYAMLELKSMLAKILMNFEILPSEIPHEPEFAVELVYKSKNGVYVKLKEVDWNSKACNRRFSDLCVDMSIILQIFICIIAIALTYILYQARLVYNARRHLTKWVPQVPGSLYFGAKSEFGPTTERIKDMTRLLNNPKKSVYLEFLNNWMIITRDYDLMEFILGSSEFVTKGKKYKNIAAWLGYAILIANAQKWRTRRRIITPAFHFSILEQFLDIFNSNDDILIEKLRREAIGKKGVDIYSYITNCALDIICETTMGVKMDAQQNKNKEYANAVKDMCEIVAIRNVSLWKNFDWLFYFSSDYKRQQKNLKILHGFTNAVIEKRRKELENKKDIKKEEEVDSLGRKQKKVLLDLLLESTDSGLTQKDIREEVDTFIFAGHDTTAAALTLGIWLLKDLPDVQKSVREELKAIFGKDRKRPITYNDLQNMTYLELVLKEILRIESPVPFIARVITKDVKYKDHVIPKDTAISFFLYGMDRDPDFHKDPEQFNPERFLTANKKTYSFIPFSAGPRNCIGRKFAMLELKGMLAKLLMNFEILPSDIPHKPEFAAEIVYKSKNGVYVKLKEADWD
ncbi:uncharacterized protein LOC126743337 [Anthonomus grandis grandis]|uniref:uncharacterized protein LOC126743337 n=1 Tax=Anthonomus grandis grandis TaxID=2921223 RepID=UPI00216675CF|nr:uncharacterized protein LOC126743337 [Anthonomus grandis grandis]